MVEFAKNKWKYSTIGLLAVLAVGFSFPQASAHVTSNVMHMLTHIFDNTEEIKADIEDIKEATDESTFKAVSVTVAVDPADGQFEEREILPEIEGTAYQGHMQITLDANGANTVSLICGTSDTGGVRILEQSGTGLPSFERDFSCTSLTATVTDHNDGSDAIFGGVFGLITYSETNDHSELTVNE